MTSVRARRRFPELVTGLPDPAAYPEETSQVELIVTHLSYIFLVQSLVYKVKKPVNLGFADFSTLGRRRYYCYREVALNQRISPDVYLGVSQVRLAADGAYNIDSAGETVDYAVKMRRMPQDRLLATLLPQGAVGKADVARIADRIAFFQYKAATSEKIARLGGWRRCGGMSPRTSLKPKTSQATVCRHACSTT